MPVSLALDFAAALLAAIAAFFWARSAMVNWVDGFDMAKEREATWKRAGRLNAWGASFAALAAVTPAVKSTLMFFKLIA